MYKCFFTFRIGMFCGEIRKIICGYPSLWIYLVICVKRADRMAVSVDL